MPIKAIKIDIINIIGSARTKITPKIINKIKNINIVKTASNIVEIILKVSFYFLNTINLFHQ